MKLRPMGRFCVYFALTLKSAVDFGHPFSYWARGEVRYLIGSSPAVLGAIFEAF